MDRESIGSEFKCVGDSADFLRRAGSDERDVGQHANSRRDAGAVERQVRACPVATLQLAVAGACAVVVLIVTAVRCVSGKVVAVGRRGLWRWLYMWHANRFDRVDGEARVPPRCKPCGMRRNFGPLSTSSVYQQLQQQQPLAYLSGYLGNVLTARSCNVTIASVQMACQSPAGFGGPWSWTVSVGQQNASLFAAAMTYDAPVIQTVTPQGLMPTTGGTQVVLG